MESDFNLYIFEMFSPSFYEKAKKISLRPIRKNKSTVLKAYLEGQLKRHDTAFQQDRNIK